MCKSNNVQKAHCVEKDTVQKKQPNMHKTIPCRNNNVQKTNIVQKKNIVREINRTNH